MSLLFIPSKLKNLKSNLPNSEIAKLPEKIFLAYSIQYKELAYNIAEQLKKQKIHVQKIQQVLGCTKLNTKLPVLLIGQGRFHAINLYLQSPIIYKLENNKIIQIPQKEIQTIKTKRKTALMKFLNAKTIGILVSTKPGQQFQGKVKRRKPLGCLGHAIKLKNKLKKQNKQVYVFLSNNIGINQFENFKIDSWVNTACSGLALDNPKIINFSELIK